MFKKLIRYIFTVCGIVFVLFFPVLILSEIFEIEFIRNNTETINIVGNTLIFAIYVQTFSIFVVELRVYNTLCNLKRLFICIVGVVIVPLSITYSYNFKKRMGRFLNGFCWYNLNLEEKHISGVPEKK